MTSAGLIGAAVVGGGGLSHFAPDVAGRSAGDGDGRSAGLRGGLALHLHRDDVGADGEPVPVAQEIGGVEPVLGAVDIGAVGRNVVQPVAAVAKTNLEMLARHGAARVRERPVEMGVTAHIEAASLHFDPQRPSVRQPIHIFNRQS